MKSLRSIFLLLVTPVCSVAGPIDEAIVAAMKLSEEPNYSWTTAVQDDARTYSVTGKTMEGGYTWIEMPVVDAIADRLGRDGGSDIEAFFRGPKRCVLRVGEAWKTLDELPKPRRREEHFALLVPTTTAFRGPDVPAGVNDVIVFPEPPPVIVLPVQQENSRPFSNAQLALSAPHEELGIIVSSCEDVNVADEVVTGKITDIGARLLLAPAERRDVTPVLGAGLFKLWIKDQHVARYQLRLEGVFLVGKKTVLVRQTSETFVKNIGTTSLEIPNEARAKLEQ